MNTRTDEILENLNPDQKEAVTHTEGPLLVIAGAGSGKTKVLTHRIAYLIEQGIPPNNILAVTFTNKAANEMKERVAELVASAAQPTIGTFHSVCVRFLRAHIHNLGYENSFVIYDTADQDALIKQIINDLGIDAKTYAPRAILSKISQAKNHLIDPDGLASAAHNQFMIVVAQCYKEYQKRLKLSQALDFDDIIMKTIELFKSYPEILQTYQDRYQYIMVDEYQDTNYAQYVLIDLLSQKYKNIMVVGDSDQSIYGFRGANMSNILDFNKQFKDVKTVKLEINYRSTKNILDVAHNVIVKNQNRHDKRMRTERIEGEKVEVIAVQNSRDEAGEIAQKISSMRRSNLRVECNDFAVLYRTNAQSRIIEEAFIRYGIPYKIIGGVKFYSRKEIKDIVAYLKVVQNHHDSVSLLRIINVPPRKIGSKTIEVINAASNVLGMSMFDTMLSCDGISELPSAKKESLKKFADLIAHLKEKSHEYNVAGLLKYMLTEIGYKEFLLNNSDVATSSEERRQGGAVGDGQTRLENVYELISVASKYNELEPSISLSTFLEEISLISDVDDLEESDNAVVLMTIHSAKGLEFPYVFLTGLEEGLFPHFNSLTSQEDLEEERRLLYVAITRAKEKLHLSFARTRMFYGDTRDCVPSQFLKDIPEEYLAGDVGKIHEGRSIFSSYVSAQVQNYSTGRAKVSPLTQRSLNVPTEIGGNGESVLQLKVGDRVLHNIWKEGSVEEVRGGIVTVRFSDRSIGVKKLALSIAPITKIG